MSNECKTCGFSAEGAAALLLRLSLGMLFFFAGLGKFLAPMGVAGVSEKMIEGFKDTILPLALVKPYLYVLPYIEVPLGIVLVLGIYTKEALTVCGFLLLSLALGMAIKQDHVTVANNLNFVFMTAIALWLASRDNPYSLDRFRKHTCASKPANESEPR